MYEKLKELHCQHSNSENVSIPTKGSNLVFNEKIFQWYNVPSAWAIICHNIWTAVAGSGNADKYEQLGLKDLIFPKGCSPIRLKDHPILFLLDFVDTIDPLKKWCVKNGGKEIDYDFLQRIYVPNDVADSELKLYIKCNNEQACNLCKLQYQGICSALGFLESDTFKVTQNDNGLSFRFLT